MQNLYSTSTRVILLRHGRSTYNEQGRYQGSSDEAALSPLGVTMVRRIAQSIQRKSFDNIYVSPLKRAQQTVNVLLKDFPLASDTPSVYVDEALREIDLPAWQGLSHQYVKEDLTQDYRKWVRTSR